ncbi:CNTN2 [Branchiostoma lanceolatum]|uniref:CNTN2 protein n=1 Tax=Branchiostoma lanceolatum TaxID=7740 RepID=A0A8K0EHR1_BRALA|nr:CNTN2 [Branchiostoma lanceolatum]
MRSADVMCVRNTLSTQLARSYSLQGMTGSKTCWLLAVLLGCCCPWLTRGQEEEKFLAANFTEQPNDVMFDPFAEQEIRLPCAAKGEKPITYRWLMSSDGFTNFRALDLNSRQPPYEIDAGALIIKNPEKSKDERFYQCEAENKHGKVLSDPAAVKFAYVDEFDPTPRGPCLLFFWVESGALDPVFRSTDQRVYVSQKEGDLYIARTEPTDLGSYQCVIRLTLEGMTGSKTCWLLAVILGCCCPWLTRGQEEEKFLAANFTEQPNDVMFDPFAEQEIRLPCAAKGEKPITYRWLMSSDGFTNFRALDLNSRQPPYEIDAGALIIKNPEKSKDERFYQCEAENKHGKVLSDPAAVKFAYVDEFDPTPRDPVSGRQGEGAVLRCKKPDAYPGLLFFWVESGALDPVFRSTDQRVYVSQKEGDLYIARTEPTDLGSYQCVIRLTLEGPIPTLTWRRLDAQGNEVAMSSRVTMEQFKRALTITNVQSGDAEIPHSFEAGWTYKVFRRSEGGSVTWDVAWPFGSSSDPVQIIWLHNARALTAGGKYRMTRTGKTASLQITDLVEADSGSYQCSIRNEHGDIYGPAATLYAGGPGSLRNFRQTESGDGYAVLGWDLPEGSRADDIGGYQVFVTPKGGGDTRIIDVSSGETSTRVDGLTTHSSNYNFQARANSKEYDVPGPLTDVNDSDGDGMDKHHLEMLKLYRPDAVKHVKRPDRVTAYLASINVLPASVIKIINNQHSQDGYNRRIVDSLTQHGGNEAFQGYCSSLRKEEKLYWLADTLEGRGLSVYGREQLMQHQSVLVERMDPDITLAYLSKQRVFTTAMTEHVSSANSREEKNRRIIHLLQSRDDDEFSVFLDALRQNQSQAHLVGLFGSTGEQKQQWNGAGQQKQQSWNITDQKINSTHVSSGSGVCINQQSEQTARSKGLCFTDPSIKSGASAMVQIGQPVILEVNGEVDNAYWLLNDGPLPQNKGINVRKYGLTHELNIDGMTPELAGTYTCQGNTPDGAMLSCDINITSMEPKMMAL